MARVLITGDFGIHEPLRVVPPKPRGSKRVWYKPNHRSFGAFIRSDQMRDATEEKAELIAAAAAAAVPPPSEDTDPDAAGAVDYEVKREAGLVRVSGNLRVKVEIEAEGYEAERAEFGHSRGEGRNRTLARTASKFGDWKPIDDFK